jgi:UDP-3-O-[3-hydroxymyristoyl] glucosamine N-acyltransferase LpxD
MKCPITLQKTVNHGLSTMTNSRVLLHEILLSEILNGIGLDGLILSHDPLINAVSQFGIEGKEGELQFTTQTLLKSQRCITFAPLGSEISVNTIIFSNPKNVFFDALSWLEKNIGFRQIFEGHISKTAKIHETAVLSEGVYIGEQTVIGPGVVIYAGVKIGDGSLIEANSVIGNSGLGVVRTETNTVMIPHIGGVVIGNNVRVGALTTIDRGTLITTRIGDYTKIDDKVHIAHNCDLGLRNIICAGVNIAGSVKVGNDCWLGLGCNLRQKINIGNGTTIGIGANVFHDLNEGSNVVGYPAKKIPSEITK